MIEKEEIEYFTRTLADGFWAADKTKSKLDAAVEIVGLEDLANRVGRETLGHLVDLEREDELVPIFTLRGGGMELSVAVIGFKEVLRLIRRGVLPSPRDLARFSAGLAEFIVLAGRSALVKFRIDGEILWKAVEFGVWLSPGDVTNVDGTWCVITWPDDPYRRRF
jgi:hypothetical protein